MLNKHPLPAQAGLPSRPFLESNDLAAVIYALFTSRLNYCNVVGRLAFEDSPRTSAGPEGSISCWQVLPDVLKRLEQLLIRLWAQVLSAGGHYL